MTLTVQSVFTPLQDLLLTRFANDHSPTTRFRFAEHGALTVESGAERHDPLLWSEGQRRPEKLSVVADRVPVDAGDGVHALLTRESVVRHYRERIVDLAQPHWAPGSDDLTRSDVSTAFQKVLADARQRLETSVLHDGTSATSGCTVRWEPAGWHDPTKHAAWAAHTFTAADPPDVGGPTLCWRFGDDRFGPREAAVSASHVDVSFECCRVWLHRDWMSWPFLDSPTWCVPGSGAQLPAGTSAGTGRSLLMGFVAVRNLELRASWAATDREALTSATSWGPFALTPPSGHALAEHAGVQIVGWAVGSLPDRAESVVSMGPQ